MRGKVIGPWVEAEATIVDATTAAHGHAVLRHKYGWMKRLGDLYSRLRHRERVVLAIRVLALRWADRCERPWWNAVGVETTVTRVAAAWYDSWGQQGTVAITESRLPPVCLAGRRASAGAPLDWPALV